MVKRCIWAVGDEAKPACTLAERVPKVHRSGDISEDQERDSRRNAFLWIVTNLWQHPEHCLSIQSQLQTRLSNETTTDDAKFVSVSTIGRLEPAWLASVLADICGLDRKTLQAAVRFDEDTLKHILLFLGAAPLSTKLPPECIVKLVAKKILASRFESIGRRVDLIKGDAPFVFQSGKINWGEFGVYSLVWGDTQVKQVVHRPTKTTALVPRHCVITAEFVLEGNWSDASAMCSLGASKLMLKDFFDKKKAEGPWGVKAWAPKEMKDEALQFLAAYEKNVEEMVGKSALQDFKSIVTPVKVRSSEAAARAREALSKKKEKQTEKRVTKLSTT